MKGYFTLIVLMSILISKSIIAQSNMFEAKDFLFEKSTNLPVILGNYYDNNSNQFIAIKFPNEDNPRIFNEFSKHNITKIIKINEGYGLIGHIKNGNRKKGVVIILTKNASEYETNQKIIEDISMINDALYTIEGSIILVGFSGIQNKRGVVVEISINSDKTIKHNISKLKMIEINSISYDFDGHIILSGGGNREAASNLRDVCIAIYKVNRLDFNHIIQSKAFTYNNTDNIEEEKTRYYELHLSRYDGWKERNSSLDDNMFIMHPSISNYHVKLNKGGFLLIGKFYQENRINREGTYALVARLNENFNLLWINMISLDTDEGGECMSAIESGSKIIIGTQVTENENGLTLNLDTESGELLELNTFEGVQCIHSIKRCYKGEINALGNKDGNYFLIKDLY